MIVVSSLGHYAELVPLAVRVIIVRSTMKHERENPTIDKLQLKGFEIQSIKNVKIYSISGKILMNLSPSENIDVSSLPNGMYLLEVESVDGFKDVKRFVKE